MDEFTVKHDRLARVATALVIAIVWALCAFVTFTASEVDAGRQQSLAMEVHS